MKIDVKTPIRRKILLALLVAVTVVVSLITFTMASFFHDDKRQYINDWVSVAAVSTAEECSALLLNHRQRLGLYAEIMLSDAVDAERRTSLLRRMFDELPELIEVAVYRDGTELEVASDVAELEAAGVPEAELREWREQHALSLEDLPADALQVRNATTRAALPAFRMAFRYVPEQDPRPVIVSGLLRADHLLRLGSRFKVFEITLADDEGTVLAHPDVRRVVEHARAVLPPQAAAVPRENRTGLTQQYDRQGTQMIAGLAVVEPGGLTVTAELPAAAAYLASRALFNRLVFVALGLLLLCSVGGLIWAAQITRPVERLSLATRDIAAGNFDVAIAVESADEIGALAGSFNQMASELRVRDRALAEAQVQLVQSEKMAAFGQLGAGIAHEVKNPLAGVLGCAELALMDVPEGSIVHENLRLIEKESRRCKEIIENLLRFARQERVEQKPTDINAVVHDAIAIVQHQFVLHQVALQSELAADLPRVVANGNQMQQVLMNLLINAQQALAGEPGVVRIATQRAGDRVRITVRDNGPGIPEKVRNRIFEPFFTTKPTGQGTGLGLSVSFGIVQEHRGEISVESAPGQGATFCITLPALAAGAVAVAPPSEAVVTAI